MATTEIEHVEIPARNFPKGVGPGSYCPSMLRVAAEAHNRAPVHESLNLRPWVVLTLLDAVDDYEGLRQVANEVMDERDSLLAEVERLQGLLAEACERLRHASLGEINMAIRLEREGGLTGPAGSDGAA